MDAEVEFTEPKISYSWTYWYAKFTELNEYVQLTAIFDIVAS